MRCLQSLYLIALLHPEYLLVTLFLYLSSPINAPAIVSVGILMILTVNDLLLDSLSVLPLIQPWLTALWLHLCWQLSQIPLSRNLWRRLVLALLSLISVFLAFIYQVPTLLLYQGNICLHLCLIIVMTALVNTLLILFVDVRQVKSLFLLTWRRETVIMAYGWVVRTLD